MKLQCGYENECKTKNCLNCKMVKQHSFILTQAEEIVIEDFAVCDLTQMVTRKEMPLMQDIMHNVMMKVFGVKKIKKRRKI